MWLVVVTAVALSVKRVCGGYRFGWRAKALIVLSIGINTFGAITFNRYWQFYWDGIFPIQ